MSNLTESEIAGATGKMITPTMRHLTVSETREALAR